MPLTNEFDVIDDIKKVLGKPSRQVLLGIGDDAAVTQPLKGKAVFTIDTMVEGVHFDLAYTTPRELGHKALAVNLSDIAAMGAVPHYALVSIGLKQELSPIFVAELYAGIKKLAKQHQTEIIGGNLVQSPLANMIDIALIGTAPRNYFTRSGASPGDLVVTTGVLGASAAGLSCLRRFGRHGTSHESAKVDAQIKPLIAAHLAPTPRVLESLQLNKLGGVTAMIDISDGLAKELHHLAEQSRVGFVIDLALLPISAPTRAIAQVLGTTPEPWALFGGEDYELVFTIKARAWPKAARAFAKGATPLTVIGKVVAFRHGVKLKKLDGTLSPLEARGWNHFVKRRPLGRISL